jgi:hypothetical protein
MVRVDVLWGDDDGTPRVAPAKLEDRSHGGLSVRMKDAIPVGSKITIKWGSEQVSGTVTNSRRERTEYVIGIKRDTSENHNQK